MIKYAKVIDNETKKVDVGLGSDEQYYQAIGMTKMDVEQAYDHQWYVSGYAPAKPHNQEIKEQIVALEKQVTDRNIRDAILGDEWAINKITQIESQIAELREQLDQMENQQ